MADERIAVEAISNLRVPELRGELSNRGLPTSGSKEELADRLREAMTQEQNVSDSKEESEASLNGLMAIMIQMSSKFDAMNRKLEETRSGIEYGMKTIDEKVEILETKTDERFQLMDSKLEKNEEKFESIDKEFERMARELERKVSEKISKSYVIPHELMATASELQYPQRLPTVAKPPIKLATYDGKASWQVYKTQFEIVSEANAWDSIAKARQLAASLRAEAADILRTIPEHQRTDFKALSDALELRFGEKCLKDYSRLQLKIRQQRVNETLQELATDVERLSHLAFSDCPAEVRGTLALQYFVDGVRDNEMQRALRMAELKDLKSALVYSMKFEAAQQATRKDRFSIRGTELQENSDPALEMLTNITRILEKQGQDGVTSNESVQGKARCWKCGAEGHFQRQCRARLRNDVLRPNCEDGTLFQPGRNEVQIGQHAVSGADVGIPARIRGSNPR